MAVMQQHNTSNIRTLTLEEYIIKDTRADWDFHPGFYTGFDTVEEEAADFIKNNKAAAIKKFKNHINNVLINKCNYNIIDMSDDKVVYEKTQNNSTITKNTEDNNNSAITTQNNIINMNPNNSENWFAQNKTRIAINLANVDDDKNLSVQTDNGRVWRTKRQILKGDFGGNYIVSIDESDSDSAKRYYDANDPIEFPLEDYLKKAQDAHRWTSFSPERRGFQLIQDYERILESDIAELRKFGYDDDYIQQYYTDFKVQLSSYLHAKSNTFSTMITGGSGVNVNRHRKMNDREQKAYENFNEFRQKRVRKPKVRLSPDEELEQAKKKLATAEANQVKMKEANKIIRSGGPEVVNKLMNLLNIDEGQALKLTYPDYAGRIGFADYQLTNNNAEIKRLRDRVSLLEQKQQKRQSNTEDRYKFDGGTVFFNYELDRIQIFFDTKPNADTIAQLKGGWNWSPREGAWQRKITPNAQSNLRYLFKNYFKQPLVRIEDESAKDVEDENIEIAALPNDIQIEEGFDSDVVGEIEKTPIITEDGDDEPGETIEPFEFSFTYYKEGDVIKAYSTEVGNNKPYAAINMIDGTIEFMPIASESAKEAISEDVAKWEFPLTFKYKVGDIVAVNDPQWDIDAAKILTVGISASGSPKYLIKGSWFKELELALAKAKRDASDIPATKLLKGEIDSEEKTPLSIWAIPLKEWLYSKNVGIESFVDDYFLNVRADRRGDWFPATNIDADGYSRTYQGGSINREAYEHKEAVKKALSEGKAVPKEVLADYPDLQQRIAYTEKEAWQMPFRVFKDEISLTSEINGNRIKYFFNGEEILDYDFKSSPNYKEIRVFHENAVKQALSEGKAVPKEVLADYPDLALKTSTLKQLLPALRKMAAKDDVFDISNEDLPKEINFVEEFTVEHLNRSIQFNVVAKCTIKADGDNVLNNRGVIPVFYVLQAGDTTVGVDFGIVQGRYCMTINVVNVNKVKEYLEGLFGKGAIKSNAHINLQVKQELTEPILKNIEEKVKALALANQEKHNAIVAKMPVKYYAHHDFYMGDYTHTITD